MNKTYQANNVAIAISSFKSTQSVARLLDKIFSSDISFSEIIVVDSLSDGSMEKLLAEKNYKVTFFNSTTNLGSAGNLNKRLEIASQNPQSEWCFCINHDGCFEAQTIIKLIESAEQLKEKGFNIGAVYPTKVQNSNRGSKNNLRVTESYSEVSWDSSNESLYALAPHRSGCKVHSELWMGWEDLIYGLQLKENGYKSFKIHNAISYDVYEYKRINFLFFSFDIGDKPSWYNYYSIRNLVLGFRYLESKKYLFKVTTKTLVRSVVLTALFKENKKDRLYLYAKGFTDGLLNRTGHNERLKK